MTTSPKKQPAMPLIGQLQRAIALHNGGRLDEADAIYRDVLRSAPRHPDALHLRALVAHAQARYAEAARLAEQAIAAAAQVANFHNTAGDSWRCAGDLDRARQRLEQAVRLDPQMAMAHHNLSLVHAAQGRDDEASRHNRRALELDPAHAEALLQALELAAARGDWPEASQRATRIEQALDAARARPALAAYHCRRARAHFAALDFAAGERSVQTAIDLDPSLWGGWALRAELAFERGALAEAELFCTLAANLAPLNEDARRNLALMLRNAKRLEDAESHLLAWLADHPDDAQARFNLATVELMQGHFAGGWRHYEARWQMPQQRQPRHAAAPPWEGGAVDSLLLYAEQGLGDTVQMLRFVGRAAQRAGGRVVLQVQAPLLQIAKRVFGHGRVQVVEAIPAQRFDAACPMMSLPLVLGVDSAQAIAAAGAYLSAMPERVERFAALLARQPGRKIGLVWRGAEGSSANRQRRLPETALAPLLEMPRWTPVSLQFGVREPAIDGRRLVDLSEHIADFEDLAAAMQALDAVVSLDTGPAHLAGALGLPVHTLLPWLHDWRWGADGERCDWYPRMTLYRQPVGGDWDAPIAQLVERLGGTPAGHAQVPAAALLVADTAPVRANRFPFVHVVGRHGTFRLPVFDRYITRSMLAYGEYSPREAEVLTSFLTAGDTAVDVGANVGTLTLAMARAVGPSGRVIALEPQAMLHECLVDSIAASAVPWVEARRQAAGARAGSARIAPTDPTRAGNFGGVGLSAEGEPVELIRLDDLGLPSCRLIKIDVEGSELEVLEGAAGLIGQQRPVLCVECDRPGKQAAIVAFLRRFGYRLFIHEPPLFSASNFRRCAVDLFAGVVSRNLLALPDGVAPQVDMRFLDQAVS